MLKSLSLFMLTNHFHTISTFVFYILILHTYLIRSIIQFLIMQRSSLIRNINIASVTSKIGGLDHPLINMSGLTVTCERQLTSMIRMHHSDNCIDCTQKWLALFLSRVVDVCNYISYSNCFTPIHVDVHNRMIT